MAKEIIILDDLSQGDGTQMIVEALLWLVGPTNPVPGPNASLWSKASAAENAAIQNGSVIEEKVQVVVPINAQFADIANALSERWSLRQAYWNQFKGGGFLANMFTDPNIQGGVWQQG